MDRINSTKMCFGCGSENPVGLHLDIESGGGLAASEWTVTENYVGWDNMLHGGILSLIADEVMGHVVDLKREKIVSLFDGLRGKWIVAALAEILEVVFGEVVLYRQQLVAGSRCAALRCRQRGAERAAAQDVGCDCGLRRGRRASSGQVSCRDEARRGGADHRAARPQQPGAEPGI